MNESALIIVDYVLWGLLAIPTLYIFVFALAALRRKSMSYPFAKKNNRFVILFPAYMEDEVIVDSVSAFLQQDYPKDKYDIVVISDHMSSDTNHALNKMQVKVLEAHYKDSSKAKALRLAMEVLPEDAYDAVVVLDADNVVDPDFLKQMNSAVEAGVKSLQAHRASKNINNEMALLDSVSEEINNSLFRRGHVNLSLSSALIGSGMMFDYAWFRENVKNLTSAGEDKELEMMLLQQRIFTDYAEDVYVYDEKTQDKKSFYKQRRRWIASQLYALFRAVKYLPKAMIQGNGDFCNKLIQWIMPPRLILLGLTVLGAAVFMYFHWQFAIKWCILLLVQGCALYISIPPDLYDKRLLRALMKLPVLFILMVANLFRVRGASKKFLHTKHGLSNE